MKYLHNFNLTLTNMIVYFVAIKTYISIFYEFSSSSSNELCYCEKDIKSDLWILCMFSLKDPLDNFFLII